MTACVVVTMPCKELMTWEYRMLYRGSCYVQARKSPVLDGVVERDDTGMEVASAEPHLLSHSALPGAVSCAAQSCREAHCCQGRPFIHTWMHGHMLTSRFAASVLVHHYSMQPYPSLNTLNTAIHPLSPLNTLRWPCRWCWHLARMFVGSIYCALQRSVYIGMPDLSLLWAAEAGLVVVGLSCAM